MTSAHLFYAWNFVGAQFVEVAIEHGVDVGLKIEPSALELLDGRLSGDPAQNGLQVRME